MRELVKVQETLDQVLDYLAGNDIGLVVENLRTNIDTSKSIVENLLIQRVVRPNLTDKHPIEGVNEFLLTDQDIEDTQFYCAGVEAGNRICESQCIGCDGFQRSYEQ